MTTLFPFESKCPKCGKIYTLLEVVSCVIANQNDVDIINSHIAHYQKECECGEVFDMSKHKISCNFAPSSEEYNRMLNATISGYQMTDEIIDKAYNKIKELLDLRESCNKRKVE